MEPLLRGHPFVRPPPVERPLDIDFYPFWEATSLGRPLFWWNRGGLTRGVPLYHHSLCVWKVNYDKMDSSGFQCDTSLDSTPTGQRCGCLLWREVCRALYPHGIGEIRYPPCWLICNALLLIYRKVPGSAPPILRILGNNIRGLHPQCTVNRPTWRISDFVYSSLEALWLVLNTNHCYIKAGIVLISSQMLKAMYINPPKPTITN